MLMHVESIQDIFNKILRNQMQYFFLVLLLMVVPFLLKFLKEFDSIVEMRKSGDKTYPWPEYTDLYKALLVTSVFIVLNLIFTHLYRPVAELLVAAKHKGREREFKVSKMIDCTFKGSYYIFASVLGYVAAKDSYYLSPLLGGNGCTDLMFTDFPYQRLEELFLVRDYLIIQLGYHLYSFILHVVKKPKNDFIEMLLHHIVTVALVGLAYYMNYMTMSLLVLFCHDFSEVFSYLVRIFVDTKYSNFAVICYVGLLVSWFYMRLVVFPFDLIRVAVYMNPVAHEIYGMGVMGGMLHILLILHAYWFYLFIKMGLRFLATKDPQDTYHVE